MRFEARSDRDFLIGPMTAEPSARRPTAGVNREKRQFGCA
jgi:hypothetical protein